MTTMTTTNQVSEEDEKLINTCLCRPVMYPGLLARFANWILGRKYVMEVESPSKRRRKGNIRWQIILFKPTGREVVCAGTGGCGQRIEVPGNAELRMVRNLSDYS